MLRLCCCKNDTRPLHYPLCAGWHTFCFPIRVMRFAITKMDKRVSPVFDVSRSIDLYDSDGYGQRAVFVSSHSLPASLGEKISFLLECDINTVLCGAITQEGELSLIRHNIETYSFVRGSISDVVEAWEHKNLSDAQFLLPGCSGPRHCCRMRRNQGRSHRCTDR